MKEAAVAGAASEPALRKPQVLIVEDEFMIALLLKEITEGLGCEVIGPLRRLQSAWEAAHDLPLRAALLDVRIDGGTAFPVAKVLQARAVPFGFITAHARSVTSMFYGQAPVLIKPFDDHHVEALLQRLLA